MAQRRETPRSGNTTRSFLEAAQQQVSRNGLRKEDIAADEKHKEKQAQAYIEKQDVFFKEHLVPILDQLAALPKRDGRMFQIEARYALTPVEAPRLTVNIHYRGKPGPMLPTYDSLMIIMDDYVDDIRFSARVVRMDKMAPDSKFDKLTIPVIADVAKLKAEIGKFVADVAPDRVAELGEKKKPAARKAAPKP